MLILNHEEVIYCHVVCPQLGKYHKLPGVAYYNRLFCKLESYQLSEYHVAVNRARKIFDEADQRFIFLVVEEPKNYTIWREDSQLISIKEFESKFPSHPDIPFKKTLNNLVETMPPNGSVYKKNCPLNQYLSEVLCG